MLATASEREPVPLHWDNICEAAICHRAGHDGVSRALISPDGHLIAFSSRRSGHQDLWLVPADGSAPPTQLTRGAMVAGELRFGHAWSPDEPNYRSRR